MPVTELSQILRGVRRQPAFAAGVVAVLALAIGANTAMFALVHAILIRPLPLADPDRLITFTVVRPGTDRQPLSLLDLDDFKHSNRTLASSVSMFGWSANLTGRGDAERLTAMRVSADYFEVTGAQVQLGRALQPDDEQRPSVAPVRHEAVAQHQVRRDAAEQLVVDVEVLEVHELRFVADGEPPGFGQLGLAIGAGDRLGVERFRGRRFGHGSSRQPVVSDDSWNSGM